MYVFLIYTIVNIYGVISANIKPNVIEAITLSSSDKEYKCPYLRSSKLFAPNVLSKWPSFEVASSLDKIDLDNTIEGLSILYYNHFENLCFLTNNYTKAFKLGDVVPDSYLNDISVVCGALKNNTHVAQNAKPGIDAINKRLTSDCPKLCISNTNAKVEPICSVSAYITAVTASVQTEIKENTVKQISPEVTKEKHTNLIKHLNETVQPQPDEDVIAAESPLVLNEEVVSQVESDKKPTIINRKKSTEAKVSSAPLSASELKKEPTELHVPDVTTKKSTLEALVKAEEQQQASSNDKPMDMDILIPANVDEQIQQTSTTSKFKPGVEAANVQQNKTPISADVDKSNDEKLREINMNNHRSNEKQQPVDNAHDENKKQMETDENNVVISPKNEVVQHTVAKNDNGKTVKQHTEEDDKGPITKGDAEQADGVKIEKPLLDTKDAPEDDIEIDDGIGPVGDGEMEYGNEVVPKPSEVKSKAEVKSVEKLKPLQTDEERYTISANYQNQNIDDSDSYFFSYFMMFCIIFICGYVAYHNKQKILALVIEGRRGRRPSRSRRPNSANYHKLDSNLEEAVTSTCNKNAPQVIY